MPPPSHSGASRHQSLASLETNDPNSYNIIGESSNNTVINNIGFTNIVHSNNNNVFNSGINNVFNPIIILDDSEDIELDELLNGHVSKDALRNPFDSPPECYPNTRRTIHNEIREWINENESKKSPLLWLNGPPAIGKSVIARTVSSVHDQVVASFFFSTSSDRSATTLSPTLAWQLARRIPDTKKHIIASLKKNSDLLRATRIEEQFDLLILQPLKKITTLRSRPVIVIDGVDECTDEDILARFLRVLVQTGEGGDMPLRFIICSRQQWPITLGRDNITNPNSDRQYSHFRTQWYLPRVFLEVWELYRLLQLRVDKYTPPSSSDTRVKLTDTLDRICPHPVVSTIQIGFSEDWKQDVARYLENRFRQPGDGTYTCSIFDLVEASCGQFIYASTIDRLFADPNLDLAPKDIFEMARPDLDNLYKAILKRAQDTILKQAQKAGSDYQTEWQFVMDSLTILVFFAENVHFVAVRKLFLVIESLLGLERGRLATKLRTLHSVLRIVPGESIQVHHRSFLEFLQIRERSGEYHISSSIALRRMLFLVSRAGLRYNIFK